ncbi:MAG: cytochrome C biogenesis protein, partial [Gammaproteobacteria bacterium]|nr:cytochrome C biogenesis protein [Gammaproteobacteria bacterium]MBT4810231.1 cytochrome C biogenesis protein [Thiotrichales bacterium]MBT5744800.1 cytochrome C biogenesis protein [Gammaproteobacteria bacterium]MBT7231151.1 cytochrome C biogenesis protein [Gammaproteobacteria bacterium]
MSYTISGSIAIVLYLLAAAGLARLLARGISCFDHPRNELKLITAAAMLLHTHLLFTLVVQQWVNLGFFHALSITSWLLVLLMGGTWLLRPVGNLGIIIFPIAAVTVLLQMM